MSDIRGGSIAPLSLVATNDPDHVSAARPPAWDAEVSRGSEESGSAGFFAIDHRAWRAACQLGLLPAICYLALARGTGPDQRTTSWSTNSIEKRTAISRNRIKPPLKELEEAGLVVLKGTAVRPVRKLVPGHEIGSVGDLPPLTEDEEYLLETLPIYTKPKLSDEILATARSLIQKGYIRKRGTLYELRPDAVRIRDPKPDWIWLPNAIIDGVNGRPSPVEIIRQTDELPVLRLFIDLYHSQSLSYDGGIPTSLLVKTYKRERAAFSGQWIAWRFEFEGKEVCGEAPFYTAFTSDSPVNGNEAFWAALDTLERLGVATFVEHLFESSSSNAEIVHPFVKPLPFRDVTEAEGSLYEAALGAARRMCIANRKVASSDQIVPVREHIGKVELRGVFRLRYRPRTSVTSEWMGRSERWQNLVAEFKTLQFPERPLAA